MDSLPIVIPENVRISVLMAMRIYMREHVLGHVPHLSQDIIMERPEFVLEDVLKTITLKVGFVPLLAQLHIMLIIIQTNVF